MPKFVKTVTKEMVDAAEISNTIMVKIVSHPLIRAKDVLRLVMSTKTKEAIKSEFTVPTRISTVSTFRNADYFEGHPVDINDSLEFGEVRFTVEL